MNRIRVTAGLVVTIAVVAAVPTFAAGKTDPGVLNGIYRIKWTEKGLVAAGTSPLYARKNHAVITLALQDGRFLMRFSDPPSSDCRGAYTVSRTVFSINFHVPTCPGGVGLVRARWSLGNGQLRFHVLRATDAGDKITWGAEPWRKIG
jgi:hypothetical protein